MVVIFEFEQEYNDVYLFGWHVSYIDGFCIYHYFIVDESDWILQLCVYALRGNWNIPYIIIHLWYFQADLWSVGSILYRFWIFEFFFLFFPPPLLLHYFVHLWRFPFFFNLGVVLLC